jgi:F0F1-type ATP synthase assembly protein I
MGIKWQRLPRTLLARITRISAHGMILVATTFLGLYIGLYLDRLTNMTPNFTLVFLILGVIFGFRGFIQEVLAERKGSSS